MLDAVSFQTREAGVIENLFKSKLRGNMRRSEGIVMRGEITKLSLSCTAFLFLCMLVCVVVGVASAKTIYDYAKIQWTVNNATDGVSEDVYVEIDGDADKYSFMEPFENYITQPTPQDSESHSVDDKFDDISMPKSVEHIFPSPEIQGEIWTNKGREGDIVSAKENVTVNRIAFYSNYKSIYDSNLSIYGLSYFADALRSKGYIVEQIYRPITSSKLSNYDALLIIGLDDLSESEIDAIEDFVKNKGKGLLVSGGDINAMEKLLSRFSACPFEIDGRVVCDPTDYEVYKKWIIIKNFDRNVTITKNVNKIIMYKSTFMRVFPAYCIPRYDIIAWPDEDCWLDEDGDYERDSFEESFTYGYLNGSIVIVSPPDLGGKVVAVMDSNVFDNCDPDRDGIPAFYEYDNDVLALNIVSSLIGEEIKFRGIVEEISKIGIKIRVSDVLSSKLLNIKPDDVINVKVCQYPNISVGDVVEVYGKVELWGISVCEANHYIKKVNSENYWIKTYGGPCWDIGGSVAIAPNGDIIVAGMTNSFGNYDYCGDFDFWVLRLDPSGYIKWQKTYGGSDYDSAYAVSIAPNGDIIVAGITYSFEASKGAGKPDVWVLRLDPNGNIKWQKTYGGSEGDAIAAIGIEQNGDIIIVRVYGQCPPYTDTTILRLDSDGNIKWQKTYENYRAEDVAIAPNGDIIVVGSTSTGGISVLRLDPSGYIKWQKTYYEKKAEPKSIAIASNGDIIVVGQTWLLINNTNPWTGDAWKLG